jgi:3-hydroxyisobutyrate dehydrogenase-like beta-hydroxyacid dehydrogenase
MSTLPLESKLAAERVLREAGHIMLDCPLRGTGAQARTRDLVVYASGDSAAIAESSAIFSGFARAFYDVGAFGNGSRMKYIANLMVFIHNVAAAEGIVLGIKAGLDPEKIVEVISAGAGGSRMLEVRGPMMAKGRYDTVTANYATYYKDLKIIGEFAMALDCPTPMLSATLPIYLAGRAAHDDLDVASVCAVLEAMAGAKRKG